MIIFLSIRFKICFVSSKETFHLVGSFDVLVDKKKKINLIECLAWMYNISTVM